MAAGPARAVDGIRVYRGTEAPLLADTGATKSDFGDRHELMDIAKRLATTECSINKLLVHQRPDEGGLSVAYLFFKPNFPLFRHAHDVNSLYVVLSGSVVDFMDSEVLRPGDIWTVKAGTTYWYSAGPEGVEVLEIFSGADQATVIYTDNPPERVQQAEDAVRDNEELWKEYTEGPLFR